MNRIELREILSNYFNLDELKTLSFDLGIDFENLGGDNKNAKARELLAYCERNNQTLDLLKEISRRRPNLHLPQDSPNDFPQPKQTRKHDGNAELLFLVKSELSSHKDISFDIIINGNVIATIHLGESHSCQLGSGKHSLSLTVRAIFCYHAGPAGPYKEEYLSSTTKPLELKIDSGKYIFMGKVKESFWSSLIGIFHLDVCLELLGLHQ